MQGSERRGRAKGHELGTKKARVQHFKGCGEGTKKNVRKGLTSMMMGAIILL
jgi:hypothetical protein